MDLMDIMAIRALGMLTEQARIHDTNREQGIECHGLPICASCRAVVLINSSLDVERADIYIKAQPEGTVETLKD